MKKSSIIFSSLFILYAFISSAAFAGDPIPGVDVGVGRNPGGQQMANSKTGTDGQFTLTIKDAGSYSLTITYDEVQALLKPSGRKAGNMTLSLSTSGSSRVLVNDHALPAAISITVGMRPIVINIPAGGATISGALNGTITKIQTTQTKR